MKDPESTNTMPLRSLENHQGAAEDLDPRGWEVFGVDGKKIGVVDELLEDAQAPGTRYLEVLIEPSEAEAAVAGSASHATSHAGEGLAPLIVETLVRSTLSEEENRLTSEHHHGATARHVRISMDDVRLDPEHDRVVVLGLQADAGLPA